MSRARMALATVLALGAACSGGSATEAERAMEESAARLAAVRSGMLQFRLTAGAADRQPEDSPEVGFELSGPFAMPEPGALPVISLDYTRISGDTRTTTQLVSNGSRAFVVLDGTAYQLPFEQTERLRAPQQPTGEEGFGGLRIDRWVDDPQLAPGEAVGDSPTDRITGAVDVVRTLNDVFTFGRTLGATELAAPEITGEVADQLRGVTESAILELLTGAQDRLPRRLSVVIRLSPNMPDGVRVALGPVAASQIRISLAVEQPNTPVTVAAPEGARPASERPDPG